MEFAERAKFMIAKYFKLQTRQSTFRTEIIAGVTTFLTMAYIIFVNPNILSETGMDKSALIAVTCLVTAVATIATGLLANAPIAMAPGMGLNAFFAYTLVLTKQITWQTALAIVFLSGLFFLIQAAAKHSLNMIPPMPWAKISMGTPSSTLDTLSLVTRLP